MGKSPVSGDFTAKKANGKDVVSSGEPVKQAVQTSVSLSFALSGDLKTKKPNGKAVISSAAPIRRTDHTGFFCVNADSGDLMLKKANGKAVDSSAETTKHRGGSVVSFAKVDDVLFFKDVKLGPQEGELRFRLIHYWEARNAFSKTLIGLEMLLIDEQNVFRVADPDVTISFTWNSVLSPLENSPVQFPEDRFRFYGHEEFEAACDLRGAVYGEFSLDFVFDTDLDFVGHIKLVNEQVLNDGIVLDEGDKASTRRVLVHVQTHDDPMMNLNLWDKTATDFYEKFKAHGNTPSVILVTTVNPKRFGGALNLSSLSSSRVFFDMDVQPTRDYLIWLNSSSEISNRVNPETVTKAERATIGDIFSYMKQEGAKVAWFECTTTIDDVVHGSAWYYISCGGCKTKATKGPTTLMCKKCGKAEVTGVAEYLTKLSVYDNNDQARFVLLGDAGRELTGKTAAELVANYFEANVDVDEDHVISVPQDLIGTIGQTHKFVIKVSKHNLEGKTQALTVTKVLTPDALAPS
ncbi:hypothetical protein HID58_046956 [Brassica napus]|uniref:Replication factor A C-terminal domain-containing protein n=1 Tax=Brassica napus TaxID=3708 RepID=A0ABQ8AY12_BRANA|nr:hypothetical protein HID58_046956 [Brassica napus]